MLSKRKHHILRFVHQDTIEHGFAPSVREVSLTIGITSTYVVNYNLERLITWEHKLKSCGKSRALGLTGRGSALFERKGVTDIFLVDALLGNRGLEPLTPPTSKECSAN